MTAETIPAQSLLSTPSLSLTQSKSEVSFVFDSKTNLFISIGTNIISDIEEGDTNAAILLIRYFTIV